MWTGGELNPRGRNDKSILHTSVRPTILLYQKSRKGLHFGVDITFEVNSDGAVDNNCPGAELGGVKIHKSGDD